MATTHSWSTQFAWDWRELTALPEHLQRRACALPHHRFERYAWHIHELTKLGALEQPLGCVWHFRRRAFERTRGRRAHSRDGAVVALLPFHFFAADHQRRQHFV